MRLEIAPDGGRIDLSAAREAEEVVVRLRYDGIDFDFRALNGACDLFVYRLDPDRTPPPGLMVARALVASQCGTLGLTRADAAFGAGFILRLPLVGPAPTASP